MFVVFFVFACVFHFFHHFHHFGLQVTFNGTYEDKALERFFHQPNEGSIVLLWVTCSHSIKEMVYDWYDLACIVVASSCS